MLGLFWWAIYNASSCSSCIGFTIESVQAIDELWWSRVETFGDRHRVRWVVPQRAQAWHFSSLRALVGCQAGPSKPMSASKKAVRNNNHNRHKTDVGSETDRRQREKGLETKTHTAPPKLVPCLGHPGVIPRLRTRARNNPITTYTHTRTYYNAQRLACSLARSHRSTSKCLRRLPWFSGEGCLLLSV